MPKKKKKIKYKKNLTSNQKLFARFHRLLQPREFLKVSDWMAKHHHLTLAEGASEPGLFSFKRTPYLKEPCDNMGIDSTVRKQIVLKGSQIGFSTAGYGTMGYWMEYVGGGILLTMPSDKVLQRASRNRVDPFLKNSPILWPLFSDKNAKDKTNNTLEKQYEGGVLYCASAQSSNDLSSVSARFALSDEASRYPESVSGEGSAVQLIENRLNTFGVRSKHWLFSTPTIKGECLCTDEYELTDQRRYFMACPYCGGMITYDFENLKWNKDEKGNHLIEDGVWYECPACNAKIDELKHKTKMMAEENGAKWIPTNKKNIRKDLRGYQISAMYSPVGWLSWKDIASQWIKNCRTREGRIAFMNTKLGLAYEDVNKETPKIDLIMQRRETYQIGVVPEACKSFALVGGIDCQGDRLEMTTKAIGMRNDGSLETYVIDHKIFYGDTNASDVNQPHYFDSVSGEKRPSPWQQLFEYIKTPLKVSDGTTKPIISVCIDSGYKAHRVYMFSRRFPSHLMYVVKGTDLLVTRQFIGVPKRVDIDFNGKKMKQGASLHVISSDIGKDKTYESLNVGKPSPEYLAETGQYPDNYIHFPMFENEYFKQLTAEEKRKTKEKKTGRLKEYYFKTRDRNEALDCFFYGTAAWQIKKLDLALPENYQAIVHVFEKNAIESWAINK
ncbi:MAG: hypothetical protein GY755_19480 [Chloroflexi bacterium]|nr:hypothetical protein [Chloroflexota bacterium]